MGSTPSIYVQMWRGLGLILLGLMARARIFNPQFKMLLAIIGLVCLERVKFKNIDFQTEAASECFDHQA
jgi:hypothetical protein